MDSTTKPILLASFAHPDDESFGIGGTLALYAQRGVSVHLICATRGEVGTVDPELLEANESIGELRGEKELRCAAEELGLSRVHLLGYRDSGMAGSPDNEHPEALAAQPTGEVAARIAGVLMQVKPQVVVTHDPIGGYKHPDHIAMHDATVAAFHQVLERAADEESYRPQKLYYNTFPRRGLRWLKYILPLVGKNPRKWGKNEDIDLVELTEEPDFPIHVTIDYEAVMEQRLAAMACHASQLDGGPPSGGPLGWLWRRLFSRDQFCRAYPPADGDVREHDLFEGVRLPSAH